MCTEVFCDTEIMIMMDTHTMIGTTIINLSVEVIQISMVLFQYSFKNMKEMNCEKCFMLFLFFELTDPDYVHPMSNRVR